ncbi:NepR family anti-sigma factor [Microvirga flavescens]|uniref:NepR family anti-sigma factor n=1 Tax=Microvirga flavescens TaxID=2249811 RepID=UPI000DDA0C98|nr:NepR family anti-sigma factor [Microvirga flavescens]
MRQNDPSKLKSPAYGRGAEDLAIGLKREKRPALSRSVQHQIGRRLQSFYDSLALDEPVPPRFMEIIDQLEQFECGQDDAGRNRRKQHS